MLFQAFTSSDPVYRKTSIGSPKRIKEHKRYWGSQSCILGKLGTRVQIIHKKREVLQVW